MSEQIPAGWYPDPKDTTGDPRPQRWWDGKGWTASTRPAPADAPEPPAASESPAELEPSAEPGPAGGPGAAAGPEAPGPTGPETTVLEGQIVDGGPTVRYPEPPPFGAAYGSPVPAPARRRKPSRLVVAATVAALLGLAVGSGVTFLVMDHRDGAQPTAHRNAKRLPPNPEGGPWGNIPDLDGNGGGNGNGNGKGKGKGDGSEDGGPADSRTAADLVNRITLPVPSGWKGGTTGGGFAALSIGSYTCEGGGTCSLGGANTGRITGGGTDVQAAAKADIEQAAKDSYGEIKGHEELKSEAVKVGGRDGWLVRWKVDAAKGNDGYVQTVVFPTANGRSLASLHLGFDIAAKAPDVAVMDTIVKGVADYTGRVPAFPGGGGDGGGTT